MTALRWVVALGICAGVVACGGSPETDSGGAASGAAGGVSPDSPNIVVTFTPLPAPQPQTPTSPAPVPLVNAAVPVQLNNPDFERWEAHLPVGWTFGWGPIAAVVDDVPQGSYAVQMGPGYTYNNLVQLVTAPGPLAGKTVRVTAQAKSSEPDRARLVVAYGPAFERVIPGQPHPGDGKWHEISVEGRFPNDLSSREFQLRLNHRAEPKEPAYFDDVRLTLQ